MDLIRSRFIDAIVYSADSPLSPGRLDSLVGHFAIAMMAGRSRTWPAR